MARLSRAVVLSLLLLAVSCASTGSDPASNQSVERLRQIGEKFYVAGDYGQALRYLIMAEQKAPDNPTIQYSLGLAYVARALQAEGLRHLQRALTLNPDYPEAHNALGTLYAEQDRLDLAQVEFEKALASPRYGTPEFAVYNIGRLYEKRMQPEEALRYYKEAVRLQPAYASAYYRMGQVLETQKRGDEAREAYGKAVEKDPDMAEAHFRYGMMSYTAGELERALYSLSRVMKLAPNSSMADEARRTLDRLKVLSQSGSPTGGDVVGGTGGMEIMAPRDLYSAAGSAPPLPPSSVALTTPKEGYSIDQRPAPDPPPATAQPDPGTGGSLTIMNWHYIVQIASFLDKENAEDIKRKLQLRGYDAVVKPFHHNVLGQVYVVQLKPVGTITKATTLMTQLEAAIEGKLVIIKVPVAP